MSLNLQSQSILIQFTSQVIWIQALLCRWKRFLIFQEMGIMSTSWDSIKLRLTNGWVIAEAVAPPTAPAVKLAAKSLEGLGVSGSFGSMAPLIGSNIPQYIALKGTSLDKVAPTPAHHVVLTGFQEISADLGCQTKAFMRPTRIHAKTKTSRFYFHIEVLLIDRMRLIKLGGIANTSFHIHSHHYFQKLAASNDRSWLSRTAVKVFPCQFSVDPFRALWETCLARGVAFFLGHPAGWRPKSELTKYWKKFHLL